jgi:NAD(P)-dependent dehydrogenase (short-subunit alcohol dehydrogenase family)
MINRNIFSKTNSGKVLMAVAGLGTAVLIKMIFSKLNRYDLRDKVVLITGGSRGLGLELARVLATKGAKIAICARNEQQLKVAGQELGSLTEVLAVRADLTNISEVNSLVQQVVDHFGKLDVLINNAGVMIVGPENVMEIEDYHKVMDSNVWSALYATKAVMPQFLKRGSGRIVNICSIGGKVAVPHMLPYSVSKFAMVGLSQGMAAELGKHGVHVTTVIPSLMTTGSPRNVTIKGDHESEYAWFKIADSLPLLAQDSKKAAMSIVQAMEAGKKELTLTFVAKIATILTALAPGSITSMMQFSDRFLPKSQNKEAKKGYESESNMTRGLVGSLTDDAAERNNEI